MIHSFKGFGTVNKAEVDVFLELSCFFSDPTDVGNLISGFSAFSESSLNTWKFMVHVLLKPGLENFEHYFASVREECNCVVIWVLFGIAFLWDWNWPNSFHFFGNENWPFPVLWPLMSFPDLLGYWVQHFHSIIFYDDLFYSSAGIPSLPLALLVVMIPKAYLTLPSRIFGYRWLVTPFWLPGSWGFFWYSYSV